MAPIVLTPEEVTAALLWPLKEPKYLRVKGFLINKGVTNEFVA